MDIKLLTSTRYPAQTDNGKPLPCVDRLQGPIQGMAPDSSSLDLWLRNGTFAPQTAMIGDGRQLAVLVHPSLPLVRKLTGDQQCSATAPPIPRSFLLTNVSVFFGHPYISVVQEPLAYGR